MNERSLGGGRFPRFNESCLGKSFLAIESIESNPFSLCAKIPHPDPRAPDCYSAHHQCHGLLQQVQSISLNYLPALGPFQM